MRWFRRSFEDWDLDWNWCDGVLLPSFPHRRPEPWRFLSEALFVLPVSFVETFADMSRLADIERTEGDQVAELIESIGRIGLTNPPTMMYDPAGKIRYHDGYHRLAAIRHLPDFEAIPVRLVKSDRIRGYGRQISEEVVRVLGVLHDLQEGRKGPTNPTQKETTSEGEMGS